MVAPVRLRQVALITRDLPRVTRQLEEEFGLEPGFKDDGVGFFGLENRVMAAGDCFIEVLTPLTEDSAGHRYLERRGQDCGYMAMFQFDDREASRTRAAELGIRIIWQGGHDDISGTHLDPRDVPGAIVSLDWADPPASWRWAGPSWYGPGRRSPSPGGITSLEVAVRDPAAAAGRWAEVLGSGASIDGLRVVLAEAGQIITFVAVAERRDEGIVACGLSLVLPTGSASRAVGAREVMISGVRFSVVPVAGVTT